VGPWGLADYFLRASRCFRRSYSVSSLPGIPSDAHLLGGSRCALCDPGSRFAHGSVRCLGLTGRCEDLVFRDPLWRASPSDARGCPWPRGPRVGGRWVPESELNAMSRCVARASNAFGAALSGVATPLRSLRISLNAEAYEPCASTTNHALHSRAVARAQQRQPRRDYHGDRIAHYQ
jgi:hypothetical protein